MSLFGKLYRVFTFGESHSKAVGCVIQGLPAGAKVDIDFIRSRLARRRPGQSSISSPRKELDQPVLLSGTQGNLSLGGPITFLVYNQDKRPSDYKAFQNYPRPGHADFSYKSKYQHVASSGGGRSSARQTIGRVIGGAVAQYFLRQKAKMEFSSFVSSCGQVSLSEQEIGELNAGRVSSDQIQQPVQVYLDKQTSQKIYKYKNNIIDNRGNQCQLKDSFKLVQTVNTRCPSHFKSVQIIDHIHALKAQGDSTGGTICSNVYNVPIGLGEPVFQKANALLGYGMLSIPSVKGFQIGSGFRGTRLRGSAHNDCFRYDQGKLTLNTNRCGGTLGGITSGSDINMRVAFKPVSTIKKQQKLIDYEGNEWESGLEGRHDPAVVSRACAIVNGMSSIVMMDLWLQHRARI